MSDIHSFFNLKPLLKSGAILFVGMTVGNVGAYLLSIIVGRLLGPAEFGVFVALVAFASMVTMPSAALAIVAAKFTSTYASVNEFGKIHALFRLLNQASILLGLGFLVGTILFAAPIRLFLHLDGLTPVFVLAISFSISFLALTVRGFLQGLQRFPALALNTGIEPILKIVGAVLFIRVGFGVNGALASIALAYGICYVLARIVLRPVIAAPISHIDRTAILRYSLPTLITLITLVFITQIDLLLVKHYFSPTEAGIYAGLATIGKIILFISTPLVVVMFPLIVTKVSRGERHWPLLAQAVILITVLSLLVLGFFTFFPTIAVGLLFGRQYLAAAPYLGSFGLAIFFLSLATVLVHYFLSIGLTRVSWLLVAALTLEVLLVASHHDSLTAVIADLTFAFGGLLAALVATYLVHKRTQLVSFAQTLL